MFRILNILWIPKFGISGAAWATSISYTFAFIMITIVYSKVSGKSVTEIIFIQKSDIALCRNFVVSLLKQVRNVLNVKFKYLPEWIEQKRRVAKIYNKLFKERLDDKVTVPYEAPYNYHTYHQYTIRVDAEKRDALRNYLKEQGIGTSVYYLLPLHLQKCFKALGYKEGDFPEAERASKEVLSLPMYPELKESNESIAFVFEKILPAWIFQPRYKGADFY